MKYNKSIINIKNIVIRYKNIIFILLIILIIISLYIYFSNLNKINESFIGKEKSNILSDLGDEVKVEKKEYEVFPPLKNKSKYDLINNIFNTNNNEDNNQDNNQDNKKEDEVKLNKPNDIPIKMPQIQDAGKKELEKNDLQKTFSKIDEKKPLFGSCNFYFNKCPTNKNSMATIKGNNLSCSDNQETKVAEAIAEIKNGYISKIIVLNNGNGYNYQNPPKVTISGKSGNGATAKANVDKNGTITSIDIIDYGYGYVETPSIVIEPPQMDGVCHLCC